MLTTTAKPEYELDPRKESVVRAFFSRWKMAEPVSAPGSMPCEVREMATPARLHHTGPSENKSMISPKKVALGQSGKMSCGISCAWV